MEIHPRTVAATYRDRAHDHDQAAKAPGLTELDRVRLWGVAEGLRLAAADMDHRADAEFDRIMAERATGYIGAERMPDPTGIDAAETYEGIAP